MSVKLKTNPKHSKNMAAIRGTGNHTTELKLVALLRKNGVNGWRRHISTIYGKPDFVFKNAKTAVFVDGCFWHRCPEVKKMPVTNRKFWIKKFRNNRKRDVAVNKKLREAGWRVVRLWEHELKRNPRQAVQKIKKAL